MNTNQQILKEIGEMAKTQSLLMDSVKMQRNSLDGTFGKIDELIKCQGELKSCQAVMQNDLKHVIQDNVEFKNGHTTFKKDVYEMKNKVENITFVGKIIAWFYGTTIGAAFAYFSTK